MKSETYHCIVTERVDVTAAIVNLTLVKVLARLLLNSAVGLATIDVHAAGDIDRDGIFKTTHEAGRAADTLVAWHCVNAWRIPTRVVLLTLANKNKVALE